MFCLQTLNGQKISRVEQESIVFQEKEQETQKINKMLDVVKVKRNSIVECLKDKSRL